VLQKITLWLGIVYVAIGILSFVAPIVEQLPLNPPDTILHLASAALTAYLGFFSGSVATA
jgi:hypothetical protein